METNLTFGEYRLDLNRCELWRCGNLVELEPQVFDLLVYLIRNRDRVISKDELMEAVWRGRIVSDTALTTRIHALRRALGESGASQQLIQTVTRRGIRFGGKVTEFQDRCLTKSFEAEAGNLEHQAAVMRSSTPSIAVQSFANVSCVPELDYFADGMVEEITMALSRIRWLRVIAHKPTIVSKDRSLGAKWRRQDSEARYFIGGSVRKSGCQVRIVVNLVEAETGVHLWSDHFDGPLENVFALQDRIASTVGGLIEPLLQTVEAARVANRAETDLTAYETYLRALVMVTSARHIPPALVLLKKAVARDSNYGPALALAANCYMRLCMDGVSKNPAADIRKGVDYAWKALEVTHDDPGVLANVARPLAYAGENINMTIALTDRALSLNPNYARGWYIRGFLKYWAGELDRGIEDVETALRLSPHSRFGTALTAISNALVFGERFNEAIPKLLLAIQEDPSFPPNYRLLAICYAHLGRLNEARGAIARLPETAPLVLTNIERSYRSMSRVPEHLKLVLSGIRIAAGEGMRRAQH